MLEEKPSENVEEALVADKEETLTDQVKDEIKEETKEEAQEKTEKKKEEAKKGFWVKFKGIFGR